MLQHHNIQFREFGTSASGLMCMQLWIDALACRQDWVSAAELDDVFGRLLGPAVSWGAVENSMGVLLTQVQPGWEDASVLRVRLLLSGQELAVDPAWVEGTVSDLKQRLCEAYGFPVCLQRIVSECISLLDHVSLVCLLGLGRGNLGLLMRPADSPADQFTLHSLLAQAVEIGRISEICYLLKVGSPLENICRLGMSVLMLACFHRQARVSKLAPMLSPRNGAVRGH